MKSVLGIGLLFAAALALGQARPAAASPSDQPAIVGDTAVAVDIAGAVVDHEGDDRGDRGRPGRGPRPALNGCLKLAHTVKQACPCNGPDGAGYENGHDGFVQCVSEALDAALVGNEDPALDECATKILERATASEIGNPDFVCPERRACERPEKPEHPGRPGKPGEPGDPGQAGSVVDHGRRPGRPCPTEEPPADPTPEPFGAVGDR